VTKKARILDVVYNASNNELVRTKTIVKNAIVQIDSTPFRQWYELHFHTKLVAKKKGAEEAAPAPEAAADGDKKQSAHLQRKIAARKAEHTLDAKLAEVSLVVSQSSFLCGDSTTRRLLPLCRGPQRNAACNRTTPVRAW
jgi:ribosomal protein S8E